MKKQLISIIPVVLTLLASQIIHAEESAPCYANVNGQLMHLVTGGLEACARTIQATRPGYGQMAVGRDGVIMKWQSIKTAMCISMDSLSDEHGI